MKIKFLFLFFAGISALEAQNLMSLQAAVANALQNNFDLQIASNEARQAQNSNHAGNAGMLPSISLNASDNPSLTDINQRFTNGTTIERNSVFSNSFNAGLLLSYTLFDGKRMYAAKRRLESMDEAARSVLQIRMQQVIADVLINYSNVVRQNAYLKLLRQLDELSTQRLLLTEQRQTAGLANHSDLYLARLECENSKQNLIAQEARIRNAYTTLNLLMNLPADSMYATDSQETDFRPMEKNMLDSLLPENPEWKLANNRYDIALQMQKEVASARLPLIRLSGAYQYNLSQSQAGFSLYNQSSGPQAGLTFSMPLFSGNVNRVNLENARIEVQNQELRNRQLMQNIRGLYEQNWQDYSASVRQLASDSAALETAKKLMDLMQQRFRLGQNTLLELKEAQRTYEETYYRLISNRYLARLAETQLLLLTGQLLRLS